MQRRPPYLLVLAYVALGVGALLQLVVPFPETVDEARTLAIATKPLIVTAIVDGLALGASVLFVAGADEVAAMSIGWRRSVARGAAVAYAFAVALQIWLVIGGPLEHQELRVAMNIVALAASLGATSVAIAPGRRAAWIALAVLAAARLAWAPWIDLWSRLGDSILIAYVIPVVTVAIAGVTALVLGAAPLVPTRASHARSGLAIARAALGGRIAFGLVGGVLTAYAFAVRDPGSIGYVVMYGLPIMAALVHTALLAGIAGAARTIGPGAPSKRLAASALALAIALAYDVRVLEVTLSMWHTSGGATMALGEMRAIAWMAPGFAALALILFASASAQLDRAFAERPMVRTPLGAAVLLVGAAFVPGIAFESLLGSFMDPAIPTKVAVLSGVIGLAGAITSGMLRGEIAATVRALDEKLAAAPEVPAAVARMPRGDAS